MRSREDARRQHRGRKACPLFVGPGYDFKRRPGRHVVVVEGSDHFQSGEHAEDAVEAAAVGLRVEMTAGQDRVGVRVTTGAPGENITHAVYGDLTTGVFAPAHEQVAARTVLVRQGEAAAAAPGRGADFRHCHQARPEPVTIDRQHGDVPNSLLKKSQIATYATNEMRYCNVALYLYRLKINATDAKVHF